MKSLLITLLALCPLLGCTTVSYRSPDGRELRVTTVAKSFGMEGLEVETPEGGKMKLSGYTSSADKALDALGAAVQRIPSPD